MRGMGMDVAFAAAGASAGCAHEPGGELVSEVALRMPFSMRTFSWVGVPSSSTLREPRRLGHGAVVDDGDLGGDPLANEPGEGGGLLAVEVGFEAVADGFMQQHTGPSGAENDGHLAGGGGDGAELKDGAASSLAREVFGGLGAVEEVS